ncbi:PucR family transcriptional regulator [Arthrobacter celericrescens]|uniref:PucR family transcriptional regulator n=1 Tax=Arthrobacter celericrescens TaxID=2320851 RepID=UPI000EA08468|nr:PucR family transcriptional regulator [Arthrobacter celericrescens]
MAMTVAELLAEPQLGLRLLAGAGGMGNRITWAHTSDLPRLWEWTTGGEIMMTNGMSIPADAEGQVELARELVKAGASALAVGEKMHAPELRPELIEACDSLPLPLINIPYPLPFIAIARTVAEASLIEESRRLRQTARIYDLLRLAGADDHGRRLLQGLAAELGSRLFVIDRRCLDPWHPDWEKLPGELSGWLAGKVGKAPGTVKNFQWLRMGEQHVLMMDIPTHANALLLVLPDTEQHPDAVVLLHAATVLGLELSRTVLALEGQRRLGSEFLLQAFDGRYGVAELERRLGEFGIPAQDFVVVSMSGENGDLANVHVDLWGHGFASACLNRAGRLHLLVSKECPAELMRHVVSGSVRIGVSAPAGVSGIQTALQESLWSLGTAENSARQLVRYREGPSWLGLTSHEEGAALVQRLLGPVIDYERGREPDLMHTLKVYLDTQRSWQKTAAVLFTHRQTVIYRIRKIGELTGLDMGETSTLAQLWFALQIHEAMDFPT